MAHSLNLKVTAEGVENGDQLEFLAKRNSDEVQGYYLAKPMTAEKVTESLKQTRDRGLAGRTCHDRFDNLPVFQAGARKKFDGGYGNAKNPAGR